jgi:hypothetical protein
LTGTAIASILVTDQCWGPFDQWAFRSFPGGTPIVLFFVG